MAKFKVYAQELKTYELEVEAEDYSDAEGLAAGIGEESWTLVNDTGWEIIDSEKN